MPKYRSSIFWAKLVQGVELKKFYTCDKLCLWNNRCSTAESTPTVVLEIHLSC